MTDAEKIRKQTNGRQTEKAEIPSYVIWSVIENKWLQDFVYLYYYSGTSI